MNRNSFLKNIALLGIFSLLSPSISFSQNKKIIKTMSKLLSKKLKKGQTIGLVTPAGVITKKQLDETIEKLKNLGFKTYYENSVLSEFGYLAGTDEERAEELMQMFKNKKVDAIMCVRGGYGAIRMLNLLDFNTIAAHPKILIGYSDITAIITAIYEKTGLITFHGPVGISSFNDFTISAFQNILMDNKASFQYEYEREKGTEQNSEFDFYTINEGKAKGKLIGGNLSVLDSMIGTAFEPNFEKKIVYLEEIDERTYRIDKMITHLIQATNLKEASGIVLGIFKGCDGDEKPTFALKEILIQLLSPLDMPVAYGFPFGHVSNKITIPTGVEVKFNATKKTLKLLEKAVI